MIPDDVTESLVRSIEDYGRSLEGKGIREILTSEYKAPADNGSEDWLLLMPEAEEAIKFWEKARRAWVSRYGDMEGYNEFQTYWSLAGYDDIDNWSKNHTPKELFLGIEFQSLRDKFGYASDDELYEMAPDEIARYGSASDRGTDYERKREEREWSDAWNQVYENQ